MTPNELAAVRERYTGEKFPGLDIPMDQVGLSKKMSNYIIIQKISNLSKKMSDDITKQPSTNISNQCQMIAMMTNSDPTAAVASVAIKKAGE